MINTNTIACIYRCLTVCVCGGGGGPPHRKSRRIETRKQPSSALGAPIETQQDESQSDHFTDDSIQRKIKDTITSLIPQITS